MAFSFLDLLFPKRCVSCGRLGGYICSECFSKIKYIEKPICPVCQRQAIGGRTHPGCRNRYSLDGLVVACRYQGAVKVAIGKVKYKWVYDIGKILTDLLVSSLWRYELPSQIILVPIPLHPKREKWRGFNQAKILGGSLAQEFKQPYDEALFRSKETKSQVGFKKQDRLENIKGAFDLIRGVDVAGKNFVLIDDVYTSGATMAECAKVLKKARAKEVWAMAVALG
jgi:ComF family protein